MRSSNKYLSSFSIVWRSIFSINGNSLKTSELFVYLPWLITNIFTIIYPFHKSSPIPCFQGIWNCCILYTQIIRNTIKGQNMLNCFKSYSTLICNNFRIYCKLLYFRQYKFLLNCEKRRFRQYVNSSFQNYHNIVCHKGTFPNNNYYVFGILDRCDYLFCFSKITHNYRHSNKESVRLIAYVITCNPV